MKERSPSTAVSCVALARAPLGHGRTLAWHRTGRTLAALLLALALPVCGGPPAPPQPATPAQADPADNLMVAVDPRAALLADEIARARAKLAEAADLFSRDEHEKAAAAYDQVATMHLSGDPESTHELQVRALWGVAVSNLSVKPLRAAHLTAAKTALQTVIASSEGTLDAMTARFVLSTLEESDRLRAQGNQQAEEIKRLNETIDLLKRADLNRRPGGL